MQFAAIHCGGRFPPRKPTIVGLITMRGLPTIIVGDLHLVDWSKLTFHEILNGACYDQRRPSVKKTAGLPHTNGMKPHTGHGCPRTQSTARDPQSTSPPKPKKHAARTRELPRPRRDPPPRAGSGGWCPAGTAPPGPAASRAARWTPCPR